jgi:mevalonate kinase
LKSSLFYAKIMLFGEYGVICDSMALTIPYSHFTGELMLTGQEQYTDTEMAGESNKQIRLYLQYLKELQRKPVFREKLDLERLEKDIENGLYFESNIPQGYGIGSSGALVAAIYDQYVERQSKSRNVLTGMEISNLKEVLSMMESYFHGISSGLDPLLCYIRSPLLIRSKMQIETVAIPREKFGANSAIFLVNSGVLGKTGPLVKLFTEKLKDESFNNQVRNNYIPSNNGCIETFLKGDMNGFYSNLTELSAFQFIYLPEMIPANMKSIWEAGLQREDFKMKLCGSGGGGFLLGISNNFRSTRKLFQQNGLELIPVYKNN